MQQLAKQQVRGPDLESGLTAVTKNTQTPPCASVSCPVASIQTISSLEISVCSSMCGSLEFWAKRSFATVTFIFVPRAHYTHTVTPHQEHARTLGHSPCCILLIFMHTIFPAIVGSFTTDHCPWPDAAIPLHTSDISTSMFNDLASLTNPSD